MTPQPIAIHYQLSPGHPFSRHAACGFSFYDPRGERMTREMDKVTCLKCQREMSHWAEMEAKSDA